MKLRKYTIVLLLSSLTFILSSWGWQGHKKISGSIASSLTGEMQTFESWVQFLVDHASDADSRKGSDPSEGPKHYIDIDSYPEFNSSGRIPQTLDSCVSIHGASFVDDNGYLPWATLTSYNNLVNYFIERDWTNAQIAAADLGHYVADGFMPMHITKNYNGQLTTGNYGIHSRYESDMIGDYIGEIEYQGSPVEDIDDISEYIFAYLYENYQYVEMILDADTYAQSVAGSTYGNTYYSELWEETGDFTIGLFQGASKALTNLLYNAWKAAGKPELGSAKPPGPIIAISSNSLFQPEAIEVSSTELGMVYLVPENTLAGLEIIREVSIDSAAVENSYLANIDISGLENGVYWLYGRNDEGGVSEYLSFDVTGVGFESFLVNEAGVYPNPFTESSILHFNLKRENLVSIKLIDSQGREVAVLHNGQLQAGEYQITLTSNDIPQGVSFVVMEIGDETITERIMRY